MKLNFAFLAVAAVLVPAEAANFGVCGIKQPNGQLKYSDTLTQKVCGPHSGLASRALEPSCAFDVSCQAFSRMCRSANKRARGMCFGPIGGEQSDQQSDDDLDEKPDQNPDDELGQKPD
ncbi:hypothetical protein LZ31DRAFT_595397, partial [Colletotrichum somersetense]